MKKTKINDTKQKVARHDKQKTSKRSLLSKVIKILQEEQKYAQKRMEQDPLRLMKDKTYFCVGENAWEHY